MATQIRDTQRKQPFRVLFLALILVPIVTVAVLLLSRQKAPDIVGRWKMTEDHKISYLTIGGDGHFMILKGMWEADEPGPRGYDLDCQGQLTFANGIITMRNTGDPRYSEFNTTVNDDRTVMTMERNGHVFTWERGHG